LDTWFEENNWDPETPATNALIASIRADALREFASHLDEDDEQEGTVHFALMARADQLEGKLENDPELRGEKL
jgi:hypothetical protein